ARSRQNQPGIQILEQDLSLHERTCRSWRERRWLRDSAGFRCTPPGYRTTVAARSPGSRIAAVAPPSRPPLARASSGVVERGSPVTVAGAAEASNLVPSASQETNWLAGPAIRANRDVAAGLACLAALSIFGTPPSQRMRRGAFARTRNGAR